MEASNVIASDVSLKAGTRLGIGWRPEIALAISQQPCLDFVEIVAENFMNMPALPPALLHLRELQVEIILHCISLSPGGAKRADQRKLQKINRLARETGARLLSDHICFVRARELESGHLMPVPRTAGAMRVMVDNILFLKEKLEVPFALENIASICDWHNSHLDEAQFVAEVLERTDSLLLLDLANLYANSINHGFDPLEYLKQLPLHRLAYVHMAGGTMHGEFYHDTHAHAIPDQVYNLLATLRKMTDVPAVMLERDDKFPSEIELSRELNQLYTVCTRPPQTVGTAQQANSRNWFLQALSNN